MPESHPTTPIFDELQREFREDPPSADRKVVSGDLRSDADDQHRPSAPSPAADEP